MCSTSTSTSTGLPRPPPIPSLLSHIAVDFVTGLSPAQGNTIILTIVDRFSKFLSLLPLQSSSETAELLIQQVFILHGIQSDHGPQFSSQVWEDFCQALVVTASLTSGYHSQSKGQMERANQNHSTLSHLLSFCFMEHLPSMD